MRETFAQFVPAEAKKPEPQVQRKRKIAKSRPAPPMQIAQQPQMRVRAAVAFRLLRRLELEQHLVELRRLIS